MNLKVLLSFSLLSLSTPSMAVDKEMLLPGLSYYSFCHKEYEKTHSQENLDVSKVCEDYNTFPTPENVKNLMSALGIDTFLRYKAREEDKSNPEAIVFLNACADKKSAFDREMGMLAAEAYDISFLDKENPSLENKNGGKAPAGYSIAKFYGNSPDCYNTGFKAAQFIPEKGDHIVFAITGTEASPEYSSGKTRETYFSMKKEMMFFGAEKKVEVSAKDKDREDWLPITGAKQFASSCAKQMITDAVELAKKSGKKIVFTGHSLGGGLSQALAYSVDKKLIDGKIPHERVQSVTFMSAGSRGLIPGPDIAVLNDMDSVVYTSLGDIVTTLGLHIGEIREMVRTEEAEKEMEDADDLMGSAHKMNLNLFKDLKEAKSVSGQELSARLNLYSAEHNKKRILKKMQQK